MSLYKQSEATAARRRIMFRCFDDDSADGYAPKTGLTFAAGELVVAKSGAAFANAANYASVAEAGHGRYWYTFSADELDTLGEVALVVVKTDVYADDAVGQVVPFDPYNSASLGMANLDATVSACLPAAMVAALMSETVGTKAVRLILHLVGAMAAAERSITPNTFILRDFDDTVNLVQATIDGDGNVTAVTITDPDA